MTEPIILSVDLGTSSLTLALITVRGRMPGWETEPLRLVLARDGGAAQSTDDWWGAFASAARSNLPLVQRHCHVGLRPARNVGITWGAQCA